MNGRILPLTFLVVCLAGLVNGPVQAAKEQVALTVDPTFFDRNIKRIAIFEVVTPAGADERVLEVPDMVQAALQEQGDFELLFPDNLKTSAERGGAKDDYATLARVWQARREIEPAALEKVRAVTSIDALVFAEITHFEQYKIDFTQEGYSTTTVGLKIQMFDTRDRKLLWQASMVHVAKSTAYNPSNAVTSDAGGMVRQGLKAVPEPPEYSVAAQKVVSDVINTFPKPKEEKDATKKSSKEEKKKNKDKDKEEDKHE